MQETVYDLVVLGLVPGTNVEITFYNWLLALLTLAGWRLSKIMRRRHSLLWLRFYIELFALPLRITPLREQQA